MPILVTRHGMVDHTTLHLDAQGQRYANDLPDLVKAIDPNFGREGWGFYANDIAARDGYERCKETIQPLADAAGYSVADFPTGEALDEFDGLRSEKDLQGSRWAAVCARIGGLNGILESVGLRNWSSATAYTYFIVFTYTNGQWTHRRYRTGQVPPSELADVTESK